MSDINCTPFFDLTNILDEVDRDEVAKIGDPRRALDYVVACAQEQSAYALVKDAEARLARCVAHHAEAQNRKFSLQEPN